MERGTEVKGTQDRTSVQRCAKSPAKEHHKQDLFSGHLFCLDFNEVYRYTCSNDCIHCFVAAAAVSLSIPTACHDMLQGHHGTARTPTDQLGRHSFGGCPKVFAAHGQNGFGESSVRTSHFI